MYKKIDIDRSATVRENVLPYRVLKLKYMPTSRLRLGTYFNTVLVLYQKYEYYTFEYNTRTITRVQYSTVPSIDGDMVTSIIIL